jgi:hypothetical protein
MIVILIMSGTKDREESPVVLVAFYDPANTRR